ncbi:MAG: Mur ligase family protein [Actinomycetota bacterium]|nr:Mur ligase family protein [Actinomycetota bacterium]
MWTYEDAIGWLNSLNNFEKSRRFETDPTNWQVGELLGRLGVDKSTFDMIHITGTNGKGSVATLSAKILTLLGRRVGVFKSPHVNAFNERISIDSLPIDEDVFASEALLVRELADHLGLKLTWFEALTAIAYSSFFAEGVDVAVVEVGIGGSFDATNVYDAEVSVITNVGHDHLELIGPTLEDVARDKSGIIKANSAAVVGLVDDDLFDVISRRDAASISRFGVEISLQERSSALGGQVIDFRTRRSYFSDVYLSAYGLHQAINAVTAVAAVEELERKSVNPTVVAEACATFYMPGRIEVVSKEPVVILDGAHNKEAIEALTGVVRDDFGGFSKYVAVISTLEQKQSAQILEVLSEAFDYFILTTANLEVSTSVDTLVEIARFSGYKFGIADNIPAALEDAIAVAGNDGIVVVTGSFRGLSDARSYLEN